MVEGNFDQYPILRTGDTPQVNIHFGGLSGHDRFSELGEPPAGPVGPAGRPLALACAAAATVIAVAASAAPMTLRGRFMVSLSSRRIFV